MKELIAEIQSQNINIGVVDGELELSFEGDHLDAGLIEKIKENKEALISLLKKHSVEHSKNELKPAEIQESYPLSNAQKRLWMVCQIEENSIAYNMPNDKPLRNANIENLRKAVTDVIERHEVLRTVLREDENGEVRQWVLTTEELGFKVDHVDYRDKERPKDFVENHIKEDQYYVFDLENGPLMRAILFQTTDDEYTFYYNTHHIISDDLSLKVLIKDTMAYYVGYMIDQAPVEEPLSIQYKDYAVWQQNQSKLSEYQEHKSYWLDRFSGELPILDLVPSKKRPKIVTNNGKHLHYFIEDHILQKTNAYVDKNGGTLFMVLLSAWNMLFNKYTSQKDIVIGAAVSGRDHADLENQIGFYIKTMPLRTKIDTEDNFDEFYEQVKGDTLSDFVHDQYPFDTLVEDLGNIRDLSRSPLFDVMITLHQADTYQMDLEEDDLEIHEHDFGSDLAKFDLNIELREVCDGLLSFNLIYNTDVYEVDFIKQLMTHYHQLLDALISNPTLKMANVEYLTNEEKAHIINEFNDTALEISAEKNVTTLFAAQAKEYPEAKAVDFEGTLLNYKELDEKSNQFANYLKDLCEVEPNDKVAVNIERSEYLIIATLGILKLGATFIPIDLNYPKERIDFILEDSKAKVNIDNSIIDDYLEKESTLDISNLSSSIDDKDIAYIIYTSGTTGNPKGVMISHEALHNYIQFAGSEYMQENKSRFLLFTSISFDLTITTLFTPICFGGSIKILPSKEHDVEVIELIKNEDFDIIKLTPSHIKVLLEFLNKLDANANNTPKGFIIGGESLSREIVNELYNYYGDTVTLWNEYGPTEATIGCIVQKLDKTKQNDTVSIGKPITNMKAYILDASQQIVPIGVEGELYLSGVQLAEGYLNQPKLTSETFIENPFSENELMYKTGDFAKWISNGDIEYLGRKDNQVKIRGNRIELAEIEKSLRSKKEIEDAVVIVKENDEHKELVAYVKASQEQDISELRSYLSSALPQYMIPNYFITLDHIPLTANGKVDTEALPVPTDLEMISEVAYMAPENEVEEKLVALWEEALNKSQIGVNDNFFHLGGDSIKGIRVISKIKKTYDIKVSLRSFFEDPTIKSLAEDIVNNLWQKEDTSKDAVDSVMI